MVKQMDSDPDFSLMAYWKSFTIADCLIILGDVIKEMKTETVNATWKKLWPEVVHDYVGFSPAEIQHSAINRAAILARQIGGEGFTDITEEDLNDLIDEHSDQLSVEDLDEMTKSASEDEVEEGEEIEEEGLSLDRLGQMIRCAKRLKDMAMEWDPYMDRSISFTNFIDNGLEPYQNLFNNLRKQKEQTQITMFFDPKPKDPQPPPESPEEGEEVYFEEQ